MENLSEIMEDSVNDEEIISSLEFLYNNNNQLSIIEKKFNKLINTEIEPFIEVILIQYYLVTLGGDYNNYGLIDEINNYLIKLDNYLKKITKIKNKNLNLRISKISEIMEKNKEKANILFSQINETYNENLKKTKEEEYSQKYNLFEIHLLQKNTLAILKSINKNDLNKHLNNLNYYLNNLNNISDTFDDENDIYCKFVDSQISVIELQIEMLKS